MVTVHGLEAKQGETSFALMVLRFVRPTDRDRVVRILERVGSLIPDFDAVVADLPDDAESPMRVIGVPWSPPEAGHAVDAQRRLIEAAGSDGIEAAWFFQTGTSLPLEDHDDDDGGDDGEVDEPVGRQPTQAEPDWPIDDTRPIELGTTAGELGDFDFEDDDEDEDDDDADDADDDADDDDAPDDEPERHAWSHGPPAGLASVPFPVDGYPAIVDGLDWEDFGLAIKLDGPWVPGEALVLRGFHGLWLAPYAMRYRNADVTIDRAHHAVHLWVDRFAAETPAAEQVQHLLWIAAQLHQVLPVLHARFVGATMNQKYGVLMGDISEPFVLGGNPLIARHLEGGELAVDAWIAAQTAWSPEELARMLDELAVEIVTRDPTGLHLVAKPTDDGDEDEPDRHLHLTTYAGELLAARGALGQLDPRTAPVLRPLLEVPAKYEHRRRAVVEILGAIGDRASVGPLIKILDDNPIKGALDSIGKDDFLATTARALGAIGDPAAKDALARLVAAKGSFNDKPRTYAANALARCLRPDDDVDDAVLVGLLETIRERNDGPLNAHAHLAYGRLARTLTPARRAVAARMLAETPSQRDDSSPMLARRAAEVVASGQPPDAATATELRDRLSRAFQGRSWDHDATVRDLAIALMVGELLPELVDPDELARLTRFTEPQVRTAAHDLLAQLGKPMAPARRFDRETARALGEPELLRWLGEQHVIGLPALIGEAGRRKLASARPVIARLASDVIAQAHPSQDLLEPQAHVVTAAVAALRDTLDVATIALFDRMLRHANHNVKWALLQDPPKDERLIGGMFHVLGERWGWQESTARDWLAQFQGTTTFEAEREKVGVDSLEGNDDDDDDDDDDDADDADDSDMN